MIDFFPHPPRPACVWRASRGFDRLAAAFARSEYAAEPKLDGWRCLVSVTFRETVEAVSRHHRPLLLLPDDAERLGRLPPGTLLDGELMGGRKENAGSPAENFVPFDVVLAGAQDVRHFGYDARRETLEDLCLAAGLPVVPSWQDGNLGRRYDEALALPGCEGLVVKRRAAPWRAGKSADDETADWLKIKREPRFDAARCALRP